MATKLYIKNDVKINGKHFAPHIRCIIDAVLETAPPMQGGGGVWMTSANDGKHKPNSKHYLDEAFDFRVWNIEGYTAELAKAWRDRIKGKLGKDYDCLYETQPEHLHIERDPK